MLRDRVLLVVLLFFGGATTSLADDDNNTATAQQLAEQALESMSTPFLKDCVDTASRVKAWRSDYKKIQQDYQKDQDAKAYANRLVSWAANVDTFFQRRSPEFLQVLGWKDRVTKAKAQIPDDAEPAVQAQLANVVCKFFCSWKRAGGLPYINGYPLC